MRASMPATELLYCCLLLLYCCFTDALNAALLMLYCCFTDALLTLYFKVGFIASLLLLLY
jgi:hypothetical protein